MLNQKDINQLKKQTEKPSVFLGGTCEDKNKWREEIKKEFGSRFFFIDPYNPDWDPKKNIYDELSAILNVDHVIFYGGGSGTEKEKQFIKNVDKDYKSFDNLTELKAHLQAIKEHTMKAGLSEYIKKMACNLVG